jgi:hypothetical protein
MSSEFRVPSSELKPEKGFSAPANRAFWPRLNRSRRALPIPVVGSGETQEVEEYYRRRKAERDRDIARRAASVALWLVLAMTSSAAAITGAVRDRAGYDIATNVHFLCTSRPTVGGGIVQVGWKMETNSASDGGFTVNLLAGEYRVTVGNQLADSFVITVPATNGTLTLQEVAQRQMPYLGTNSTVGNFYLLSGGNNSVVTGLVQNAFGSAQVTNVTFSPMQRPWLLSGGIVYAGWPVNVDSAGGAFSISLVAGDYRVQAGGDNADSFVIRVPGSDSFSISAIKTNRLTWTSLASPRTYPSGGTWPLLDESGTPYLRE